MYDALDYRRKTKKTTKKRSKASCAFTPFVYCLSFVRPPDYESGALVYCLYYVTLTYFISMRYVRIVSVLLRLNDLIKVILRHIQEAQS